MYRLKIDEESRIQYATRDEFASPDMMQAETLPEGNITDYRYVDGLFIYDPHQAAQEPQGESTVWDDLAAAIREGVNSV